MKNLNEPLDGDSGLIPLVEIAKLIYPYWNSRSEPGFVDFDKPEFDDKGRMLVNFCRFGESSAGISDYLFFENNQFKILSRDYYWTGDHYKERVDVIFNQIILLKKLIEIGAITKEEIGL